MEIMEEVKKCLGCKMMPCQKGCPLGNETGNFIALAKERKYQEAFKILEKTTVLSAICGLICPHEEQCQGNCIKRFKGETVKIGSIEQFIGSYALENGYEYSVSSLDKKKRVAIIGSGPAGLTCAAFLRKEGFQVTIYEKQERLGGLLSYGIPDFRLNKELVGKVIQKIVNMGIDIKTGVMLGRDYSLEELRCDYDAVFLGIGANVARKMGIPGEDKYALKANTLLENGKHPDYRNKKVLVVGGGNVAMDAARTIKALGAKEVVVVYRRDEEEMPAFKDEVASAKNENIEFLFQTNVVKILKKEVECVKVDLVVKDDDKRKVPVDIKGSNFRISADYVVMAIGSVPDVILTKNLGVDTSEQGYISVDNNKMTSIPGVFAAGDIAHDKATVAWAAKGGRDAALAISKFLD